MESNWRQNVYRFQFAGTPVTLAARFEEPFGTLLITNERDMAGGAAIYQFLPGEDFAEFLLWTMPIPPAFNFPYGFNVIPD